MFSFTNLLMSLGGRSPVTQAGSAYMTNTMNNSNALLMMVKSVVPILEYDSHKGSSGRLAVIGGSTEYTGAPYFAAISMLKTGADLSHVFCTERAAVPIKSYSPELIVHPLLDHPNCVEEISPWLNKIHALTIGPGLGQNTDLLHNVESIIQSAKDKDIPLVIDADGMFLLTKKPDIINNYRRAILTPNAVEFQRLYRAVLGVDADPEEAVNSVSQLSRALGNVTIVCKGPKDIISDGNNVLVCCHGGSPRRCGGQGDLLSGSMGVFSYWSHRAESRGTDNSSFETYGPTITAAYAACMLTRQCSKQAFMKHGRSMTTTDMISEIHEAFEYFYG